MSDANGGGNGHGHGAAVLELVERYDASPQRVYAAWTDVAELRCWWGPEGFSVELFEADIRPGGLWRSVIRGSDGKAFGQAGQYITVEPHARLVFTFQWEEPGALQTCVTVTFSADGDGCAVTFRQTPFKDDAQRESHTSGWRQCLSRLGHHLRTAG